MEVLPTLKYPLIRVYTSRKNCRERKGIMSTFQKFMFAQTASVFVNAMSVLSLPSLAILGFLEIRGKHLQYSKFCNVNTKQIMLSSRTGMLTAYTPAFLAAITPLALFPDEGFRCLLVNSALAIHFFKRLLEVLFIHKYSGGMVLSSAILISVSYFVSSATMIYAQYLTRGFSEPSVDFKYPGIVLFLMGIGGNFYHHYLLSKLRESGDREYKIPKGGLFDLVICPHYFFEIMEFIGVSFISQTLYAFSFGLSIIIYLMGRSCATRKWYLSKFEDFPKDVKALIPYVF